MFLTKLGKTDALGVRRWSKLLKAVIEAVAHLLYWTHTFCVSLLVTKTLALENTAWSPRGEVLPMVEGFQMIELK